MRGAAFLIVALALASGCSLGQSQGRPAASDPVAQADAKLYNGDYDGAEASYLKLIGDSSSSTRTQAHARAHYATLLDYVDRFSDALAQAQTAVQALDDADDEARLTRALDWGEDLPGALAAGKKAVGLDPRFALAHVYYSEVLADNGRYSDARAEILNAEVHAGDAYTRAELEREWANYYRGKGDPLEELNHLELSLKAQPQFPERSLELARHDYAAGRASDASALLRKLGAKYSKDYRLATAVGDTAFINNDGQTALDQYTRALSIRSTGGEAALGLAELQADVPRDFKGAHDTLVKLLQGDAKQTAAAEYLFWLDQLLLKTDGGGELKSLGVDAPDEQAGAIKTELGGLNAFRKSAGVDAVQEAAPLDQAALAHAYFYLFNFGDTSLTGTGIHNENPQLPGYTGANSAERAAHFGYTRQRGEEVIAHAYLPGGALGAWTDSVYHRLGILDPEAVDAGYAQVQVGALSIEVLDFGLADQGHHGPVYFPADGQSGVAQAFTGSEVPDPLLGIRYPVGFPITVQVGSAGKLDVSSATLRGPHGQVAVYPIPAGTDGLTAGEFAMVPRLPLASGSYTATIVGSVDGSQLQQSWTFTVE